LQIGLELDPSRVTAVAVDDAGSVTARAVVTEPDLAAAARSALARLEGEGTPNGAIVGVASPVPDAPAVLDAVASLRQDIASGGPLPSGAAAALAEAWIGAAKGVQDVVFFAASDRTSAGILRDGVPVTGARGRAAMVGWLALNPVEREDYRKIGCLETEVASGGVVRRLIWRVKAGDRSQVQDLVGEDLNAITVDQVLDAARAGDGVAISVIRDTAKYLGMAAANLVLVVDPTTLVLGGVMASASDLLLEPIRVEIGRRLPRSMFDALAIVPAELGADAAAIGAARLSAPVLP
jgi:predicted NBD/HSP70 family sugar kinase